MSANSKYYRDHLYRLREHPVDPGMADGRNSFTRVYLSLVPFLMLEYYVERTSDVLPSGLVFPMGFLLFWAFYYTYYRPGLLEDRLSTPKEWNPAGIVTLLVGVAIWFVKVTVVELSHLLLLRWLFSRKATPHRAGTQGARRPSASSQSAGTGSWNTGTGSFNTRPSGQQAAGGQGAAHGASHAQRAPKREAPPPKPPASLPPDILSALDVLGLPPSTDWNEIHKRYRELAKKFHPDLNQEITELGRRFIRVDQAYRKLNGVKSRYFEKRP